MTRPQALTPHQCEVVWSADRHVLVHAGAGSGKTGTVVQRILYLLGVEVEGRRIECPLPLDRIAAITFTNAAAADLTGRIRSALRAHQRWEEAEAVDTARIGTIHAFAGDILKEFALRRGGGSSLEVLEEGDSESLVDEAVRDALVAAVTDGSIPGLDALLASFPLARFREAVGQLVREGDRLRTLARHRDRLPSREQVALALAEAAAALLEDRLRERGTVDFDHMLIWTRDLIRDDPYVRRTLQRRIGALVVDEFQDVDPVQREIAWLLGDPESERSDTPRLLLVGDPKQSIYRFRRADVTSWHVVERHFASGTLGRVITLPDNFRSRQPILDFVHQVLGPCLNAPMDPTATTLADYEVPLTPMSVGGADQASGPPVELIAVPEVVEKAAERRRCEAAAIATRARALHEDEGIGWSDMAVLLPVWTDVEVYGSALRHEGIPTDTLLDDGFFQRQEVVDCLVALQAIADPHDDRHVAGFLRSPFVAVRDETLLELALVNPGTPWPARALPTPGPDSERCRRGFDVLDRLGRLRNRVPHEVLLQHLLDDTGYLVHLHLLGRDGAIANVRKLQRMARAAALVTLEEWLRDLAIRRERRDRVGVERLHDPGDDVLSISTVHSAKGLEWRVVFWADVGRKPFTDTRTVLLTGRNTLALKDPELESKDQAEAWQEVKRELDREGQAEQKRLWYVAATRARERLIVTLPGKGAWAPAMTLLGNLDVTSTGPYTVLHAPAAVPDRVTDEPLALAPGDGIPGPLPGLEVPPGRSLHSATEALQHARCPRRRWFQYVMGIREPSGGHQGSGPGFGSAVARGQIVHDVLEKLRLEEELDLLLEDAIGRWDPEAPPPEATSGSRYRLALRTEIEEVAGDSAWREVANRPDARRELRFLCRGDGDTWWQGALDLVAPGPDGITILDVKTSDVPPEEVAASAERYAIQRQVYTAATAALSGRPVSDFRFHFSRPRVQHRILVGAEQSQRASEIARALSCDLQQNAPALATDPAECARCGFRRVGWCAGVEGPGDSPTE